MRISCRCCKNERNWRTLFWAIYMMLMGLAHGHDCDMDNYGMIHKTMDY